MSDVIHCIFLIAPTGTAVVNLSRRFNIQARLSDRSLDISFARANEPRPNNPQGVSSLLAIYGENGAGKTGILLDIANLFGNNPKHQTAGALFERDGRLLLRRGKALQKLAIEGDAAAQIEVTSECPRCASVFYTSSPFEAVRRNTLVNNTAVKDVSPIFGERNEFDAPALLEIEDLLNMDFISRCKIRLRLKLLTVGEIGLVLNTALNKLDGARSVTARSTLVAVAKENADQERFSFRCWLSLAISLAGGKMPSLPKKTVNLLSKPTSKDNASAFWVAVRQNAEAYCIEVLGKEVTARLYDFLSVMSENLLDRAVVPAKLRSHIDEKLGGRNEDLKQCADLKLLDFSLSGLSSGETAFAMLFAALYGGLQRIARAFPDGPLFLLIDEGEMFMHPKWQREYIYRMLEFCGKIPSAQSRIHLLLTTHSLIVAADAPSNSLVNVKTGDAVNAFGLGPRGVLEKVYGVREFQGRRAEAEFSRIEQFLAQPQIEDYPAIKALIDSLADAKVAEYLGNRVNDALARRRDDQA